MLPNIRDYDEHGKGSRANFLYFVRPLVYREGYLPTSVSAGSQFAENSAIVVLEARSPKRQVPRDAVPPSGTLQPSANVTG